MPSNGLCEISNLDYIIPMGLEKEDDFDATEVTPAALLRLEIRYLRRDIGELKEQVKQGLGERAKSSDVEDHETRLRAVEQRMQWAIGFGAAAGLVGGYLSKFIKV